MADSLEELEEANDAQVLEEAGGNRKTLKMLRFLGDWVYDSSPDAMEE